MNRVIIGHDSLKNFGLKCNISNRKLVYTNTNSENNGETIHSDYISIASFKNIYLLLQSILRAYLLKGGNSIKIFSL